MKRIRYSAIELLITLILLFLTAPFVQDLPHGHIIEAVLVTLVMISAVLPVGSGSRTLTLALVLAPPALISRWLHHLRPDLLHPSVYFAAALVFFAFVVANLLRFLIRAPRVDGNVLCAGISGFLMLGLLWTPVYILVAQLNPGAFSLPVVAGLPSTMDGSNAFYFSFITLCTVGYGDIAPVSKAARMLSVIEAITGLFYMAVMVSRLVSLYSTQDQSNTPEGK
jgi:voltage-gated potassium channel